ncbi:unnamed protein product [Prorocentrum cordatum]|uniref:Uncharacterized protein n=1 Tax=Prorocentrum cordatum TaxID=2364126 RepID=A0ABN9RAJ8_9DINO|nr:unnamed protein product [Polarella glacialis]
MPAAAALLCMAEYAEFLISWLAICGSLALMAPKRDIGKGQGKGLKKVKVGDVSAAPPADGRAEVDASASSGAEVDASASSGMPPADCRAEVDASASSGNFPPPPLGTPDFDGGRGVVRRPYNCDICDASFPVSSFLVPCDDQGNVPQGSARVARGMQTIADMCGEKQEFKNTIDIDEDKPDLRHMCFSCFGLRTQGDSEYYVKERDGDKVRLHSSFGNVRKKYFGRDSRSEADVLQHLAAKAFDRMPSDVTWDEVYHKVCVQSEVAAAGDFHVVLGGGVLLMYSCPKCFFLPVKSKFWLRCVKSQHRHEPGKDAEGGHWRCPFEGCLEKWTWGAAGKLRVILIPEVEGSGLQKMVIGATSESQEHTITLLKSAKLLETVKREDGSIQQIGTAALVAAIKKLNEEAQGQVLASGLQVHNKRTAGKVEIKNKGLFPYCSDPALMLGHPGATCRALHLPPDTPAISPGFLQEVLDVLVCFYDLSQCKVGGGRAIREAYWAAVATQNAKRGVYFPG